MGHIAIAYLSSRASADLLKTKLNIPLVLTLSVLPDVDILFPFLQHRGPTHSVITALVVFAPFFIAYRKEAVPYFVALVQHALIGDFIAGGQEGGTQLLWPITRQYFGTHVYITSSISVTVEWVTFLVSILIMLKTKDMATFFRQEKSNLILTIPTFTVLLPTFMRIPLYVPVQLIPPHLIYLAIFSTAIIIELVRVLRLRHNQNSTIALTGRKDG